MKNMYLEVLKNMKNMYLAKIIEAYKGKKPAGSILTRDSVKSSPRIPFDWRAYRGCGSFLERRSYIDAQDFSENKFPL